MRKLERFGNFCKRETLIFPKVPKTNAWRFRVLREGVERERGLEPHEVWKKCFENFEKLSEFNRKLTKRWMKLSCFPMNLLEQKFELLFFSQSIENKSELFVTWKMSELINECLFSEFVHFYSDMLQQLISCEKKFQNNTKAFVVFM